MALYYPDELINEIISANDIVDVVSSYVKLSRSGGGYKGLCPFHGEKTPSFHISSDKQLYHCFGCGAGGSVLQFVMNMENLDFVEAVKYLAERAKIALPENDGQGDEFYNRKQAIYNINSAAAKFFYKNLNSTEGERAKQYILGRGIDPKTITTFGLGYALDSYDALLKHLIKQGFDEQQILDASLAKKSEKNGKVYDFFRNRIIFPIIDIRGNVIAFGGRVMGDELPKYLNSADSLVFNKSKTLFALNFAKKTCHQQLILCEGYMDVISLHQAGFTNSVAGLGTALTDEHAKIISRYTGEVVLCYDSDAAGQKATSLALEHLNKVKIRTRVLSLTGAKDPDEFIKKKGKAAFENLLNSSENAVLYKINKLKQQYSIDNVDEKIELTNKMAEIFAAIENPIEQEVLIKDVANEMGISPDSISAQVKLIRHNLTKKQQMSYDKAAAKADFNKVQDSLKNEECLLASIISADNKAYSEMEELITPDFFTTPSCKAFISEVLKYKQKGVKVDMASVIASLPQEYAKELSGIITNEKPYENPARAAKDIYNAIKNKKVSSAKNINSPEDLNKIIEILKKQKS